LLTRPRIWLDEFARELTTSTSASPPFEFTGFDISAAQFPAKAQPGFNFVVHDMTTPFAEQYLGHYDVVHVRLVFLAIPKDQIASVVQNLVALLKPGGYLAWDEFELGSSHDLWPDTFLNSIIDIMKDFMRSKNLTLTPTADLRAAFESHKLENIITRDYVTFRHPELATESQVWNKHALSSIIPPSLVRLGRVENMEMARAMWLEYEGDIDEAFERGVVPGCPVVSIVARKGI
jgi:hypothetical protein